MENFLTFPAKHFFETSDASDASDAIDASDASDASDAMPAASCQTKVCCF